MFDLERERILHELEARAVSWGRPLVVLRTTASTNDDAKEAAKSGAPEGAAFVADRQTSGRGRLGRVWHSPAGENLYASFVLRPTLARASTPLVTFAAGLAVVDVIAPLFRDGGPVSLKWPNDVFVDGRKIAGILCEAHWAADRVEWIVVGIGLNVRTRWFPHEIADKATSLALSGARSIDRASLFALLASALASRMEMLRGDPQSIVLDFVARDALAGQPITIDGEPVLALGIADDGSLRIRRSGGVEARVAAGDVQLVRAPLKSERPKLPK